ncbi:nucleoside 2-deoxyribosyltransferase [Streptomyces sp. NPDC059070]|uniref:nucleoside 2-deoxyribosyltransferase n=1 Tax=Streptomyces sp. NPDC059070 TaxID=3346713 RepID=UPI0036AD3EAE
MAVVKRGRIKEGRILVHFGPDYVSVHRLESGGPALLTRERFACDRGLTHKALAQRVSEFCGGLREFTEAVGNQNVRLYASGVFQQLPQPDAAALVNSVYVDTGLYCNIVGPELEQFYRTTALSVCGSRDLVEGLVRQEFRSAVVCGSFQQSLGYIEDIIARLRESGTDVLSPRSTTVKPETAGSSFILFEYQDLLKNERDTWRHKYVHLDAFRQADAVVVCNPGGRVGKGTIFELGFMSALSKRIVFTQEPQGVSLLFPCEVGLPA